MFSQEMSRWFGFGSSGGVWLCVDTLPAGDFYTDGLVSVPREMSRWFGSGSSGDVMVVWFWFSGDVKMVWFCFLGRCHGFRKLGRCRGCVILLFLRLSGPDNSGDVSLI